MRKKHEFVNKGKRVFAAVLAASLLAATAAPGTVAYAEELPAAQAAVEEAQQEEMPETVEEEADTEPTEGQQEPDAVTGEETTLPTEVPAEEENTQDGQNEEESAVTEETEEASAEEAAQEESVPQVQTAQNSPNEDDKEKPFDEAMPTMPTYGFVVNEVTEKTVYQAGEGTVTITPADDTNPTTIELNNATLVGPGKDEQYKPTTGPVSKKPTVLTFDLPEKQNTKVILTGENHITDFYDVFSTYGTNAGTSVEISGEGSLTVTECTYFINALCNVIFDGAKADVNVTKGAVIAGVFNVSHSGIIIKNQSDLKFSVAGENDPDGFMAGDVTIDDSKLTIDTAGTYGIYNYFGFLAGMLSGGGEFSGTVIRGSEVNISSAATPGYGGIFCYQSGDVTISNSKLNVTKGQNGIRVGSGNVVIDGNSEVSLNGSNVGVRIDTEGGLTVSDTAEVYLNAPYGIVTPSEVVLKDKAAIEITADKAASNTAAAVNVQNYDSNGYYAAGNTAAASADGSAKWNGSDTLDSFQYFKLTPAGTSEGWNGIYDGQEHMINVTLPKGTTVEYSEDGVNYTAENPAYADAEAYTVYYRVLMGGTVVAEGSEQVNIVPKTITVTPNAQSKYYSDDDPELTYMAIGLVEGDTLQDIILVRAEGEELGEYKISASQKENANPNYQITFGEAILTITPKPINKATVSLGKGLTANGEEQTQTVTKVLLDGKEIPADAYTVTGNTAAEPGSYKLTVTAKENGNYTGSLEWTFVVAPAKAEKAPGEDISIGSGTVKVAVKSEGDVPPTTLLTDKAEILAMLVESGDITADELAQIANGASVDIVLTVKEANVSEETQKLMEQSADDYTIGQYLDISLFKYMTVNGTQQEGIALHETADKLTITVQVTESLINKNGSMNRSYSILRSHDGAVEALETNFDAKAKTLTFKTDRFSDYAIAYKDTAVPSSSSGSSYTAPDDSVYYTCGKCGYHDWTATENGYRCDHCGYLEMVKQLAGYEHVKGVYEPASAQNAKNTAALGSPQTGDSSNLLASVAVLAAALMGVIAAAFCKRKSGKR